MAKINLEDLFETTNQKEGIWFEPEINGEKVGIEFKILGAASDVNVIAAEKFTKATDEADKEKDTIKKRDKNILAICDRVSAMVIDIRGANGDELILGGKKVEYSKELVDKILFENIDIRTSLLEAILSSENFMTKKF